MQPPLAYITLNRNDFAWTERAFDLITEGRLAVVAGLLGVTATGQCPRCSHDVHFEHTESIVVPPGVPTGLGDRGSESTTTDTDLYIPVDIICHCLEEHPGRPVDVKGCGIIFTADVPVAGNG